MVECASITIKWIGFFSVFYWLGLCTTQIILTDCLFSNSSVTVALKKGSWPLLELRIIWLWIWCAFTMIMWSLFTAFTSRFQQAKSVGKLQEVTSWSHVMLCLTTMGIHLMTAQNWYHKLGVVTYFTLLLCYLVTKLLIPVVVGKWGYLY